MFENGGGVYMFGRSSKLQSSSFSGFSNPLSRSASVTVGRQNVFDMWVGFGDGRSANGSRHVGRLKCTPGTHGPQI